MSYAWNPADKGPDMMLADDDFRVYKTDSWTFQAVRSVTELPSTGRWRFSLFKNAPATSQDLYSPTSFGLYAGADPLLTATSCDPCAYIGYTPNSYGFDLDGSAWHDLSKVGGDFSAIQTDQAWITVLYDADAGKVWLENSVDGLIGDPEGAGTGEYFSGVPTGLYIGYGARYETEYDGDILATLEADLPATTTTTFLPLPLPATGTLPLTVNNAHSTLDGEVAPGATGFSVAAGEGLRFPEVVVPYYMVGMLIKKGEPRPSPDKATEVVIRSHAAGSDDFNCEEVTGTASFVAGDLFVAGSCSGIFNAYERRNTSIIVSSDYTIQEHDKVVVVDTDTAEADVTITYPTVSADVMVIATGSYNTIFSGTLSGNPTPLTDGESIRYIYSSDMDEWRPIDA